MKLLLLLVLSTLPLLAQPVMSTELRNGVLRADVWRVFGLEPITDESLALPGELLFVQGSGFTGDITVWIGPIAVPATAPTSGRVIFTLPESARGSFVEISVVVNGQRTNTATFPVTGAEPGQLTRADVAGLVTRAAGAIDDPKMAIAVTDRSGRPLAIFRKPQATDADVETALSLARTGAFFSHNQAPLSSRTVRTISREHFPNGIPNQPAAALFGIENTNRGCELAPQYAPGKLTARSFNAAGTGPSAGIGNVPGGLPIYKSGPMVGGIGVAGIPSDQAEFATVAATFGTEFFVPLPLPYPAAVFIDGIRLPFVNQTTRPAGTQAAASPAGTYQAGPRDGNSAPDGWLVEPTGSATLTAAEVRSIIERTIDRASRTRAVIRLPLGTRAKFVIAVTDLDGNTLGAFRMPDSTIFSIDVAVTKARNVVYFSSASTDELGLPRGTAVTNRTIGFGSQPFFPSGIDDSTPGPFRATYLADIANPCTQGRQPPGPNQSGIVFFPGSAPLYKSGRMVGGLGVSGDGVEQDDYATDGGIDGFEPPTEIRADNVFLRGVRLPYLKFPRNPEQ